MGKWKSKRSLVITYDVKRAKVLKGGTVVGYWPKNKRIEPKYKHEIETTVRPFTYSLWAYSGENQPRNIQYVAEYI